MEEEGPLLPGWTEHESPEGRYYFHAATEESRWEGKDYTVDVPGR